MRYALLAAALAAAEPPARPRLPHAAAFSLAVIASIDHPEARRAANLPAALEAGDETARGAPAARSGWRRLLTAYVLWLLFPLTGAHHLYLGRNRAALLSSVTCGYFGCGWVVDAFRIPHYASELAKAEAACAAAGHAQAYAQLCVTPSRRAPELSPLRLCRMMCSEVLLGLWFFYHASRLLPRTVSSHMVSWVSGASAAVAVWLSATGGISAWAASAWAVLPVACSGLASVATSALLSVEWPAPERAALVPSLRLKPAMVPLVVGVGVANLIAPQCNSLKKRELTYAHSRRLASPKLPRAQ